MQPVVAAYDKNSKYKENYILIFYTTTKYNYQI